MKTQQIIVKLQQKELKNQKNEKPAFSFTSQFQIFSNLHYQFIMLLLLASSAFSKNMDIKSNNFETPANEKSRGLVVYSDFFQSLPEYSGIRLDYENQLTQYELNADLIAAKISIYPANEKLAATQEETELLYNTTALIQAAAQQPSLIRDSIYFVLKQTDVKIILVTQNNTEVTQKDPFNAGGSYDGHKHNLFSHLQLGKKWRTNNNDQA